MSTILKSQSKKEEIANAISHGVGLCAGLIISPLLIYKVVHNGINEMLFAIIGFSIGLIMTYLASTVYHSVQKESNKNLWRKIDHISIYYLIGGTYLPIIFKYMPYDEGLIFLIIMWSLILFGTVMKIFFTGKYEIISLILYLFLGFMLVFKLETLWHVIPQIELIYIALGGFFYTAGVYFYIASKIRFSHMVWHIFVLLGTLSHVIAIWYML